MKSTERPGVDIRVALQSGGRSGAPASGEHAAASEPSAAGAPQTLRGALKAAVRRMARGAYRLVRPFTRPLAFRMRAYFAQPLQAEMAQLRQMIAQERTENRRAAAMLERQLAGLSAQVLQELRTLQSQRVLPVVAPAARPASGTDASLRALHRILSKSSGAFVARLDAAPHDSQALTQARTLLATQPEAVLLLRWPAAEGDGDGDGRTAAWRDFFEAHGLNCASIKPNGSIARAPRLEGGALELLVARADSPVWQQLEGAA